jgi:hypothetical protein
MAIKKKDIAKYMSDFIKNNWLNIIGSFGIFVASGTITIKIYHISGLRWWLMIGFFSALWFSGLYEIVIRRRIRTDYPKKMILVETVLVWIVPLLLGYALGHYLIVSGQA